MTSHLRQSIQGGGPRCLYSNLAWFLISHPDHEVKRRIKIPKLSSVPKIPIAWPVPWIALAPLNLSADTRQEEGLVWPIHFHPLPSTPPPPFFPPLVTLVHCFHSKTFLNNSLLSSFLYSYRLVRDVRCSLVSSDEDSPFPSLYIPFARSNISISLPSSPLSPNTPPTTIIMPEHEEDLVASQTEGFKVGEKKTIEEYQNLGMCYLRSPAPLPGNPIPLPLPVVVASWHPTSPPPPCLLLQSRQMYIASIPDTPPLKLEIVSLA